MNNQFSNLIKGTVCAAALLLLGFQTKAQQSPAITHWLQNTTDMGSYYMSGNSTPASNNTLVNCQKVEYSDDYVYITTAGIPSYPTGPFLDGNPSQATDQEAIFKFPLNPSQNTGTLTSTTAGNIGVFVNGVALYDYRDGVAWNPETNEPCGGPGNSPCPGGPGAIMDWNRDAIPAEMEGFDCSKGHPSMGNYHHHQNPSAFNLDLEVVSTICNLYDADGLYAIDSTMHSPLLGYAYDGFPIYGAYGYQNVDGTGDIVRIKSGYALREITQRTHHGDGSDVDDGPDVSDTYFLGYFREDYSYEAHADDASYLDENNGRFCVTPEYPDGTYAYFCTVDAKWNSTYPYVVGPTFYGEHSDALVTAVGEETTVYEDPIGLAKGAFDAMQVSVFPNPASDLIAIQIKGLVTANVEVNLLDLAGRIVSKTTIKKGSTIAYFDVEALYDGTYIVQLQNEQNSTIRKVTILRD